MTPGLLDTEPPRTADLASGEGGAAVEDRPVEDLERDAPLDDVEESAFSCSMTSFIWDVRWWP